MNGRVENNLIDNRNTIEFLSVRYAAYFSLFFLSLYLFINAKQGSDLLIHTQIVEQLDKDGIVVPHFLFHVIVYGISKLSHISFFHTACLVMAVFVVTSMILIECILRTFLKDRYSDYFLLFVSLALMLVSSIYFPLINLFPYEGIWSPNPWHNPTFIAARPFALLSFYWYALEITKGTYFEKRFSVMRISILLVICALIKPNFILAFAPASMFFCLFLSDKKIAMLLKTGLLLLPVLVVLIFQFLFTYYGGNIKDTSSIQLSFFEVWRHHAESVPLAFLQGTAFPLTVLAMLFYRQPKAKILLFSWAMVIAGLLIFGLLCETGDRKYHANFSWTYMSCLNILFIYRTVAFLRWVSDVHEKNVFFKIKISLCLSVFLLHFFSGIYYIKHLMSGNKL